MKVNRRGCLETVEVTADGDGFCSHAGALLLVNALLFEANELGAILDAMNDVGHLLVGAKARRVKRAPMPFLEASALLLRLADVVLLDRHGVRHAILQHPFQGGSQVADTCRGRIARIIRKYFEDSLAKNLFALRHGCAQVGIADCDNLEVNGQHQIQPRRRFEYGLKVEGRRGSHRVRRYVSQETFTQNINVEFR